MSIISALLTSKKKDHVKKRDLGAMKMKVGKQVKEPFDLTEDEFFDLLNKLRPAPKTIDIGKRKMVDGYIVLTVYSDGEMVHRTKPFLGTADEIQKKEEGLIEYYSELPILWPGCRGVLARHLGVEMDKAFQKKFDSYIKPGRLGKKLLDD